MPSSLHASVAAADITPDRPLPNYNGLLTSRTERTLPLESKVLLLDDGATRSAVISIDATFIDAPLVAAIRQNVSRHARIPPPNILVAATHSHATPATCPSFLSGALPKDDYLQSIVDRTGEAARRAAGAMHPVTYAAGAIDSTIGWCRRYVDSRGQAHFMPEKKLHSDWRPESASPLRVRYVVFETADRRPIAAMINIPCHNNFVFETYHADFFACAARRLRERLDRQLVTVTLPAPSGDIACRRPDEYGLPGDAVALAEEAGRTLAEAILADLSHASRQAGQKLVCRSVTATLRDRTYEESDFCHDDCRGDSDEVRQRIRARYDPEEAAVRSRGDTTCDVELQCIALGDTAIVTNPAELFSAYDARICATSPFRVTLVSELTNGYCGYVPTPEDFAHGCYETHRTVYTSRLAKDAGEDICRLSRQLLSEVGEQGV